MSQGNWTQPEEKMWYSVIVDGKTIATVEENKAFIKERDRISGLAGILIRPASLLELIKVNAKTKIPKRIFNKMQRLSREMILRKNK